MSEDDKVYIVEDDVTEERFVFTDYETAKQANNVGNWSRRFLRGVEIDPDEDEWGSS